VGEREQQIDQVMQQTLHVGRSARIGQDLERKSRSKPGGLAGRTQGPPVGNGRWQEEAPKSQYSQCRASSAKTCWQRSSLGAKAEPAGLAQRSESACRVELLSERSYSTTVSA